ncbi:hypothetical protein D3C78_18650 [compost metagenome]
MTKLKEFIGGKLNPYKNDKDKAIAEFFRNNPSINTTQFMIDALYAHIHGSSATVLEQQPTETTSIPTPVNKEVIGNKGFDFEPNMPSIRPVEQTQTQTQTHGDSVGKMALKGLMSPWT